MAPASLSNHFLTRLICIISAAMMAYLWILLRQGQYSQGSIRKLESYDYFSSRVSDCDRMLSQSQIFYLDHMSVPFYSLLHEPFKSVPVIWTVHEYSLAHRIKEYNASGMIQIIDAWKEVFSRANVIVFPNYILPVFNSNLIVISTIIQSLSYG